MQMSKKNQRSARYSRARRINPETLDMVVMWTQLVFPDLKAIQVTQDPHTGKFLGNFIISANDLKIPLQAASDGTLKWLAFVSLLTTSGGTYSFEEPENFLHPKMQQFIVSLIRDSLKEDNNGEYFILSTHSETLINQCAPKELILFSFNNGATSCKRLDSPEAVTQEINKTGFGLGYYYANNAVS
jgi:predicted ATPase